uniref:S1 RNA-binding domain-containing protein n=1 Tax=Staphylococcus hyicus TaxID=1284 RepID=UPI00398AB805
MKRLGAKTFEQSIGFLRIVDGDEPLDNTPIHPESYSATYQLLEELKIDVTTLGSAAHLDTFKTLDIQTYAHQLNIGIPTLEDIVQSLMAPHRDPRDKYETPQLKSDVLSIEDLSRGMKLNGTVRNVVDFGAFIDVGVKQDGLVHISKLAKRFVKHPMDVVSVGDIVEVWVDGIDQHKGKVSLTMIDPNG